MDKVNDTDMEKKKSVDKQKQAGETENLIVAVFKKILGFNYHKMGTKKDF